MSTKIASKKKKNGDNTSIRKAKKSDKVSVSLNLHQSAWEAWELLVDIFGVSEIYVIEPFVLDASWHGWMDGVLQCGEKNGAGKTVVRYVEISIETHQCIEEMSKVYPVSYDYIVQSFIFEIEDSILDYNEANGYSDNNLNRSMVRASKDLDCFREYLYETNFPFPYDHEEELSELYNDMKDIFKVHLAGSFLSIQTILDYCKNGLMGAVGSPGKSIWATPEDE